MAKTFNNLFENIIQFDELYQAYLSARKGKRRSWPCRHLERNLEGELIQLQNELIWGQYRTCGYREFYVHEPKTRKITALKMFRDRIVQHAIYRQIEPIWEARFIHNSYACRVGKGTHKGINDAQRMLRQCRRQHGHIYCLKADISKFFASMDHDVLKGLIRQRIADTRLLAVIDDIIDSYSEPGTPGKGLPIGNLTSQLFANIYLDALDQWMKCRRRVQWYARYMDDFIVIAPCKDYLQALRLDAERFLQDHLQLRTNHKTQVFPVAIHHGRGLDFLGCHLWTNKRRLRRASVSRAARNIRKLAQQYATGRVEHETVRAKIISMTNHARNGHAEAAIAGILRKTPFVRKTA